MGFTSMGSTVTCAHAGSSKGPAIIVISQTVRFIASSPFTSILPCRHRLANVQNQTDQVVQPRHPGLIGDFLPGAGGAAAMDLRIQPTAVFRGNLRGQRNELKVLQRL